MLGGKHTAIQNEDGTWNVLNVPIMVEHSVIFKNDPRGGPEPVKFRVNKDWMLSAAAKQQKRMREDGYIPPLHIHHHKPGAVKAQDVEAAGKWRISAIRRAKYEGKMRWITFADFLQVPPDKFEKMDKGQLDYRSVEIMNLDKPEIDSLALLDHEVPFFRLSVLTISKKIEHPAVDEVREAAKEDRPCLMYRAVGHGARVLFAFKEAIMPDEPMTEEEKKKKAEEAAAHEDDSTKDRVMKAMEILNAVFAEMFQDEDDKDKNKGTGPAPVEVESGAQDASGDIVRTFQAPTTTPAPTTPPVKAEAGAGVQHAEQMGKMQGEIDKLRNEKATDKAITQAVKDLAPYGCEPEETAKVLYAMAAKDGLRAMQSYVMGRKEGGSKDPDPDGDLNALSAGVSTEMQPYANLGPKVYEAAVRYGDEYEDMKGRMRLTITRKQYVDEQIRSEGLDVPAVKEDK